jgi:hypothetical protein
MKRLLWTNVVGTNTIELWHLSSEVKGDDEREGNDGNVCDKATSNPYILMDWMLLPSVD